MSITRKLAEIAGELDKRGLYEEADKIDDIIKSAIDFGGTGAEGLDIPDVEAPTKTEQLLERVDRAGQGKHTFNPGSTIRPRKRYMQTLNEIRKELNLGPGMFDRDVGMRLSRYFPGVWTPGDKTQRASDILAAIQQRKQQYRSQTGTARTAPGQQAPQSNTGRRGGEVGQSYSPTNLFPSTSNPEVKLKEKDPIYPEL